MATNVEPTFRPSLVICVGKAGELIREHLTPYPGKVTRVTQEPVSVYHLLANVDSVLRQSIGVLQVTTEGGNADPNTAVPVPLDVDFPADPDMPREPGDLETIIDHALVSVQSNRRIIDIRTQGYTIPDPRTQVFIVGEANDSSAEAERDMKVMKKVLHIVREVTRKYNFETPVFYFLNGRLQKDYYPTLQKAYDKPGMHWSDHYLANFSYLYEPVLPFPAPTFQSSTEMRYATAEAVMAFISTGLTSLQLLANEMQIGFDITDYSPHVGSVSTSMIYFPHATALRYCSSLLSAELMQVWRRSYENSRIAAGEHDSLQHRAKDVTLNMWEWMRDSEERPYASEVRGPDLHILNSKNHLYQANNALRHQDVHRRLVRLTAELFGCFSEEKILDIWKKQKSKSWSDLVEDQSYKATGLFPAWEQQARSAWDAAGVRLDAGIKYVVDEFWGKDDEGFARAKIFVDELDEQLVSLSEGIIRLRQEHVAEYRRDREVFREKALGEWNLSDDQPNITGDAMPATQQLRPTMAQQPATPGLQGGPVLFGLGGSGGGIGGGGGGKTAQHLPQDEQAIALDLGRKVTFKQGLVPSRGTLLSAGLLGGLTFALAANLPGLSSAGSLFVDLAVPLTVVASWLTLSFTRSRELKRARRDTLEFYRRYYASQCEYREDLQRMQLLRLIKGKVLQMRIRLNNLSKFFENIERESRREANWVNDQLFDGAGSQRDILIANGDRLQKTGRHTLQSVEQQVNHNRQYKPLQTWHFSLDTIKQELIARLRQRSETLLEMEEEAVRTYLADFMDQIVDGYLTGALVNIGSTLDKPEIWRELLERVSRPMYFARVGMRDPRWLFVCGSGADLAKSTAYIPSQAIQVRTRSTEWLIVAAFFSGGQPTGFNADALLPAK